MRFDGKPRATARFLVTSCAPFSSLHKVSGVRNLGSATDLVFATSRFPWRYVRVF
jgi:hypothetical protein